MRPRLIPKQARQGDVLLVKVDDRPPSAFPQVSDNGLTTIALGEHTGHHHSFQGGATLFRPDDMPSGLGGWLEIEKGAVLTHQEHDPIVGLQGTYLQAVQVEEIAGVIQVVED